MPDPLSPSHADLLRSAPTEPLRDDVTLLRELGATLRAQGFFTRAERWYHGRLALVLPLFAAAYAGLLVTRPGLNWQWISLVVAAGLLGVQLGLLAHDAGHLAMSRRRSVNELWGQIGMSLVLGNGFTGWRDLHNQHHRYCQREDLDPDMQNCPIIALYPDDVPRKSSFARKLLRYQGHYFSLLAMAAHPYALRFASLRYLVRHPQTTRVDRVMLLGHYAGWLVVPSLCLGPMAAVTTYAATSLVIGTCLTALFAINHVGMPRLRPGEARSFLRQQAETSRNIAIPRPLEFLFGGLNYQIEHHLFPGVSQPRLRQGQASVEAFCHVHGIAYQRVGFLAAQRAMLGFLRRTGRAD